MENTKYLVKKETTHHRLCSACKGTGINSRGKKCTECTGGIAEYTHTTEIGLLEAIYELGLIKK